MPGYSFQEFIKHEDKLDNPLTLTSWIDKTPQHLPDHWTTSWRFTVHSCYIPDISRFPLEMIFIPALSTF